jgi:hypothetical protein
MKNRLLPQLLGYCEKFGESSPSQRSGAVGHRKHALEEPTAHKTHFAV